MFEDFFYNTNGLPIIVQKVLVRHPKRGTRQICGVVDHVVTEFYCILTPKIYA